VNMRSLAKNGTALAFLAAISMAFAHHSDGMYDLERVITLRGVISDFAWSNPHVEMQLTGISEAGERVTWVIEMSPPGSLSRNGVSSDMFVIGE
jgi:hypothetical protein